MIELQRLLSFFHYQKCHHVTSFILRIMFYDSLVQGDV